MQDDSWDDVLDGVACFQRAHLMFSSEVENIGTSRPFF